MKILLIADEEERGLWDYYAPGKLKGYELILSAGDLKAGYLSFLVTMANRPLLYVPGNHDVNYEKNPPEGCESIDGRIVKINGLRILGLGGSMLYSQGPNQYTERQMRRRIRRLSWKIRRCGGVDVVLSHAPIAGYGDMDDPAHRGFECFMELIEKYEPKLWVHGHVHKSYGTQFQREHMIGSTRVVNACGKYEVEI